MRSRYLAAALTLTLVVVGWLVPAAVVAQDTGGVARTPDGQPDLQGVWDYRTITPLERPDELAGKDVLTNEEAAEFEQATLQGRDHDRVPDEGRTGTYNQFWWDYVGNGLTADRRTSLIVAPPDGRVPPLTAEGQRRADGQQARRDRPAIGPEDRNLWERCLTRRLPTLPGAYNNNLQIFQAADHVVVLNEMIHEARVIPLDNRPHLEDGIRQWRGDARGRWDGDTLVIDTTNFTDKTNYRGSTDNLHLVERFTRVDAETLRYEVEIQDSTTFMAPWTVVVPMTRNAEPIFEYACHERNYGLDGILAGARADDRAAAEGLGTESR